jgi:phosphate starvation-inducible membrane PsiE
MANEVSGEPGWRPRSTRVFVEAEYLLYVALAVLLCVTCLLALAGAALKVWAGVTDWADPDTVFVVIDQLLVVLMLIEILHTVLVSVRSGTLTPEPFLIVGLIASIRRMLVITLESSQAKPQGGPADVNEAIFHNSMIELGVLGMLILVMVVSIFMLRRQHPAMEARREPAAKG